MNRFIQSAELLDQARTNIPIAVVGAGGIGSWLGLFLTKMGFSIIDFYDGDTVEIHNADNQLYGEAYVGLKKVEALKRACLSFGSPKPIKASATMLESLNATSATTAIYVVAVDNIIVRKQLWDSVKMRGRGHWIDPRMGGDGWSLYTVNMADFRDQQWYEKTLHTAEQSAELPCGQRGLICIPAMLAAVAADQIRKITMTLPYEPRLSYSSVENQLIKV